MKKTFIILGFATALISVVLAVTPLSNLAIFPIIIAVICGLILFYISKKEASKIKTIQYIFLLVIIALSLTIYKSIVNTQEIGDIEQLEQREEENLEDSKELLEDIEIDENL
ncbi:MAG: DUF2232 domain-containing protein [Winogradskyella sp.]|uniref:FUSC family protein n=1 Tax=Winogradskyella sp. TaxID=1883156 RepID=UPI0018322ACE|nr:DUF2232 domain-containing protein [Winogradskyella sp.]